jgi:hypothetical protein
MLMRKNRILKKRVSDLYKGFMVLQLQGFANPESFCSGAGQNKANK